MYILIVSLLGFFVIFYLGSALEDNELSYQKVKKKEVITVNDEVLKFNSADKEYKNLVFLKNNIENENIILIFKDTKKNKKLKFIDVQNVHEVLKVNTEYLVYANRITNKNIDITGKLIKINKKDL